MSGRATTDPARNTLTAGTELGSGTGGSRGRSGGGCGGPEGRGGVNNVPGPGEGGGTGRAAGGLGIDLEAVIRATVSASVTASMARAAGIKRAAVEARSATEETGGGLSEVIKSHLRHICGVAADDEVPDIWAEATRARTGSTNMSLLTQLLKTDPSECRHQLFGHAEEMLHVSFPLLDFVMKGRFSNIGSDPACPDGGFLGWTSPQGPASDRGTAMAATEADAVARDSRTTMAD